LLNISGGTLRLAKSRQFIRLLIAINCFAFWMMYQSGFPVIIKAGLAAILLLQSFRLLRDQSLAIGERQLIRQNDQWLLDGKSGIEGPFDKHGVVLEAGLFFLLRLSSDDKKRLLVIFFDQVDTDDYRTLRILEKMT